MPSKKIDDDEWLEEEPTPAPFMVEEPKTPEARQARMEWVVNDIWKDTKRIKRYMPKLMTKKMCDAQRVVDHPGIWKWASRITAIGGAVGILFGGWIVLNSLAQARTSAKQNEELAAEFRKAWPTGNGYPIIYPVPAPVPLPDAAPVPAKPRKKIVK